MPTEVLDDEILRRIRADVIGVESFQPGVRVVRGITPPHRRRHGPPLGAEEATPEADLARLEIQQVAVEARHGQLARAMLPWVGPRGVEDLPCQVVVADPTPRDRPFQEPGAELTLDGREPSKIIPPQAALPGRESLLRARGMAGGGDPPHGRGDASAVGRRTHAGVGAPGL